MTFVGAREQVQKQLRDRGDIPIEALWDCAGYLAKTVLDAIGDLFKGAKSIQTWFSDVARVVSRSVPEERLWEQLGEKVVKDLDRSGEQVTSLHASEQAKVAHEEMTTMVWTTPLGLPIVQPYRKLRRRQVC